MIPISVRDAYMETSADKRSRESPDSTLKQEHKSLKTSGVAVATNEESDVFRACAATAATVDQSSPVAPTIRWKVKEKSEVRQTMWRFHHSSPAWKLKVCVDAMKVRPVDLSSLAQETSVQFASVELVEMAASCLGEITKEMEKDESKDSSAVTTSLCPEAKREEKDATSQHVTSEAVEASTKDQTPCDKSTETDAAAQKSESTNEETSKQQQDAVASKEKTSTEKSCDIAQDQPKVWVDRLHLCQQM